MHHARSPRYESNLRSTMMKPVLFLFFCSVILVLGHSSTATASEIIEPFPVHSEFNPLIVESPVTFRWHDER